MQAKQQRLCVFGIGSHHGTDQIGWLACEKLKPKLKAHPIDWHLCRTPSQLPELFASCDNAVIIDAMKSDDPAGTVISLTQSELAAIPSSLSSHGIGVAEALQLAEALGQLPTQSKVLGVSTPDANIEDTLLTALPQLEKYLLSSISTII